MCVTRKAPNEGFCMIAIVVFVESFRQHPTQVRTMKFLKHVIAYMRGCIASLCCLGTAARLVCVIAALGQLVADGSVVVTSSASTMLQQLGTAHLMRTLCLVAVTLWCHEDTVQDFADEVQWLLT